MEKEVEKQTTRNEIQYESQGDTMQSKDMGDRSEPQFFISGMMGGAMGGAGGDGSGGGGGGFIGDQQVSATSGGWIPPMDPAFDNSGQFFGSVFSSQNQPQRNWNWPIIILGVSLVAILGVAVWRGGGDRNYSKANKNSAKVS